jgi:hypothetical protein
MRQHTSIIEKKGETGKEEGMGEREINHRVSYEPI